jgi:transposase
LARPTYKELLAVIEKQQLMINELCAKVSRLEEELAFIKNRKNSNNSHIPPSKDENRPKKNQSLREKTLKKQGGQPGHEGKTLELSSQVDKVVKYAPSYCSCCGNDLSGIEETMEGRRQVIDIPPITPERIEHQVYSKTCGCGHISKGKFPSEVKATVQYGSNVEALIAYMHTRQYLPFNRMKEFFSDAMSLPISEGGIYNVLQRFAKKSLPVYQQIKERIEAASFLGTDETGAKVNGKKHWFWTWQNDELTFIVHSDSRGTITIENNFPNGLPNAVLQHDRWASHFQCDAMHHQLCTAHLLRDLNYIEELHKSQWASDFKKLLLKAIGLKKELSPDQYHKVNPQRQILEKELDGLLWECLPAGHKKAITFQKKLKKHKEFILYFLQNPKVPPDNNGSERAIRNIKVKQKISGQFKSLEGADIFAIIRSVIDTTIKSGQNVLFALSLISKLDTE